jgi:uncharacterized membrane protein YdfJ with MMPL/SSD domain
MSIIGIFTVAFGITVTYSTLLLMRTRETLAAGAPSREAVRTGLRQTAPPATGVGLVMIASLIPFTVTDLINVRQFRIGVALAVLLDVAVARPVLLAAAAAVLGRLGWWPTSPLQRARYPRTPDPRRPAAASARPPSAPGP